MAGDGLDYMSTAGHPNFEDEVIGRFDRQDKQINKVMDKIKDHDQRLQRIEEANLSVRVKQNEDGISSLMNEVRDIKIKIDDLPNQFIEVMNEQNVLYLKNFSKRAIRWVGGLFLIGSGAVVSELVKVWFF